MKSFVILSATLFLCHCGRTIEIKNQENLFDNCMKTFNDRDKCREFLSTSAKDIQTEEQKREEELAKLTLEQLAGLKLRKDIQDILPGKNGNFVKGYLGEPDEIKRGGEREYWVYKRPVSKYDADSPPDREIIVIFRKSFVENIDYRKPR